MMDVNEMSAKIALIILYFGKLPDYFNLFKLSIKYNPQVDILLYTDQIISDCPDNLFVKNCSFGEIRNKIQEKFDFNIALDKPYKLCDYKPAYGYIFEDKLGRYDFWGHCDIDMIFGDVVKFLPNDINKYDKLYCYGHLTLYKNTFENNRRFMLDGGMSYKDVFSTNANCIFDEGKGIQVKYNSLNVLTYFPHACADILPWHSKFFISFSSESERDKLAMNYKNQIFYWENGKVYRAAICNGKIVVDEFNYLHFQKRNLQSHIDNLDSCKSFYITPKGCFEKTKTDVTKELIKEYNHSSFFEEIKARLRYYFFRIKHKKEKIVIRIKERRKKFPFEI